MVHPLAPAPPVARRLGRAPAVLLVFAALAAGLAAWLMMARPEPGPSDASRRDEQRREDASGAIDALERDGASARLELVDGPGRDGGGASSIRLSGPGRIEGVVLERIGGDPVAGVDVLLLPVPPVAADIAPEATRFLGIGDEFSERIQPIARTLSGPNGRFSFQGVREGRWYLGARSDFHVLDGAESVRVLASGAGGPATVWVRQGGRVQGRVVHAQGTPMAGQPVPGASVALGTGGMGILEAAADGRVSFQRGEADSDGRFAFAGVPAAEGYELAALGEATTIAHVNDIAVTTGATTEVLVELRAGGALSGRILSRPLGGGEPEPLAGALVAAMPRGLRHLKLARELLEATHAVTDESGTYLIEGLPFGEADVLAMADGHVPGRGPVVQVAGSSAQGAPDFILPRGPMVRGRVVDPSGQPVAGARVLWNVIDIEQVDGRPTMASLFLGGMRDFAFPTTGSDGRFIAGPFPREAPFELRVLRSGYESRSIQWTPSAAGGLVDGVADPEGLDEIEVRLGRGGALSGRVVDGKGGEPLRSFTITVTGRIESDSRAPSELNPFAAGVEFEGPDGEFQLPAVAAGAQTLRVNAEGFLESVLDVTIVEGESTEGLEVELSSGATIAGRVVDQEGDPVAGAQVTTSELVRQSFRMMERQRLSIEAGLAVKGRAAQRMPPVGFLRYAVALGLLGPLQTVSEPDGRFVLRGLEPGSHDVLAYHPDYRAGSAQGTAVVGETPHVLVVRLAEGGGVRGVVSDRFGRPIEDATVIAASPGLTSGTARGDRSGRVGALHQARTSSSGSYEIRNMEAGPYILLSTRGDESLSITSLVGALNFDFVSVPEDRVVTHDIVDRAAGACRLSGLVTRGGEPLRTGVLVAVAFEATGVLGLDLKVAPIENDGSYAFEGLSPGEYQLRYDDRRTRSAVVVEVPDAPQLVLDVALPDAAIEGRVVDRGTGEPVRGARVEVEALGADGPEGALAALIAARGGRQRDETDSDGRFRIRGLAEGRYRVRVTGGRRGDARYAPLAPFDVEVGQDEERDLGDVQVDPGLSVAGTVVDEAGRTIDGARIRASMVGGSASASRQARSGEDGSYRLRGLGPGTWELVAEADGYAAGEVTSVEIGAGSDEVSGQRLVVPRGTEVTVLVLGSDGLPASGVSCVLTRKGAETVAQASSPAGYFRNLFSGDASTDERGELTLGRYGKGRFELRLSRGLTRQTESVEVSGEDQQRIEVQLR